MKRSPNPKMITANELRLGHVVYLGLHGWVNTISEATLYATQDEAEAALATQIDPQHIVGAYIVDRPANLHMREDIRANGPTIEYLAS